MLSSFHHLHLAGWVEILSSLCLLLWRYTSLRRDVRSARWAIGDIIVTARFAPSPCLFGSGSSNQTPTSRHRPQQTRSDHLVSDLSLSNWSTRSAGGKDLAERSVSPCWLLPLSSLVYSVYSTCYNAKRSPIQVSRLYVRRFGY